MAKPSPGSLKKKLAKLADIELLVLRKLKVRNKYAEVALISNSEMERIRKELVLRPDFKGEEARKIRDEESVNVLSFPEPEGFPESRKGPKRIGEIYINRDITKGELDSTVYLFIHGLLHLLGYDHLKKRDRIHMERLEKELWLHVFSLV